METDDVVEFSDSNISKEVIPFTDVDIHEDGSITVLEKNGYIGVGVDLVRDSMFLWLTTKDANDIAAAILKIAKRAGPNSDEQCYHEPPSRPEPSRS